MKSFMYYFWLLFSETDNEWTVQFFDGTHWIDVFVCKVSTIERGIEDLKWARGDREFAACAINSVDSRFKLFPSASQYRLFNIATGEIIDGSILQY